MIVSSLFFLLAQVGFNPTLNDPLGEPDELVNRPPRTSAVIEAPSTPESMWLTDCLSLVEEDAARAHSLAQIRRNETSGTQRVLANHCLGLAATGIGRWDDAVTAFSAARDETPADELRARARFGTMAGNAALGAGEPERALILLQAAENDARQSASATLEALATIDSARALVAADRPDDALTALDTATRLTPENAEGWLLKATLLRRLDRLDEAQTTIAKASEVGPQNPQIGLEAGVIAVLSGREEAARSSWQSVIDIEPDGPAAAIAQEYIAQLGPPAAADPAPS